MSVRKGTTYLSNQSVQVRAFRLMCDTGQGVALSLQVFICGNGDHLYLTVRMKGNNYIECVPSEELTSRPDSLCDPQKRLRARTGPSLQGTWREAHLPAPARGPAEPCACWRELTPQAGTPPARPPPGRVTGRPDCRSFHLGAASPRPRCSRQVER